MSTSATRLRTYQFAITATCVLTDDAMDETTIPAPFQEPSLAMAKKSLHPIRDTGWRLLGESFEGY
jgi:hypothetical protein